MARTVKFPGGSVKYFDTEFIIRTNVEARSALEQIVALAEAKLKELATTPGSGREYRISRGRIYRASAPGDPPTVKEGLLRASITGGVTRRRGKLVGIVSSPVIYAPFLELGTFKMAPRPMWRRVFREIQNDITRIFKESSRP